jgi:hypothetical protein
MTWKGFSVGDFIAPLPSGFDLGFSSYGVVTPYECLMGENNLLLHVRQK